MFIFYKNIIAIFLVASILLSCKEKSAPMDNRTKQDSTLVESSASSQNIIEDNNLYADVDISPMDMSYFPDRYPQHKIVQPASKPPIMRVIYSRPHLQGRELFEEILQYGQPWRLGANEATELNVFQPVTIGGKKIPVGRYTLYAIPKAGYWTIALNNNLDLWGLKQDSTMDVVRVQVPVTYYNPPMEYLTMVFEKTDTGANLVMAWDDALAKLPIKI